MLVLTRKYQEKICIGGNITITVLRTKGKAVRLGIEAPPTISVVRGELKPELAHDGSELSTSAVVHPRVARVNQPVVGDDWVTKSRLPRIKRRLEPRDTAEIKHQRIQRSNVDEIIPGLVNGNGALREFLNQRSTDMQRT
jgi:carbon storage regulator